MMRPMTKHRRLTLASAALALLLPAAAIADASPEVELLDAGKGKKRALRLSPKKGSAQTHAMTMDMQMSMSLGGRSMPAMKMPTSKMTMVTKVVDVKEGLIRYAFEISDVSVDDAPGLPPGQVEAMRTAVAGVKGAKGSATVDPRGRTMEADFELPKGAPPAAQQMAENLRQAVQQLSAPLPKAPVGVGAKWRVSTRLDQMGFPMAQIVTYELKSLKGDQATLKMSIEQKTTATQVSLPGLPPGTKAELLKLDSAGAGEMRVDLGKLAPKLATTDIRTQMETKFEANGQGGVMTMDMAMGMRLEEK